MMPLDQIEAFLSGPALLAALVGLGLGVGILTGLFGVGGAFLINPLLLVAMGMKEQLVIGSSLSFTIGAATTGLGRHMRSRNVDITAMVIIGTGAIAGAVLGAHLLAWLKDALAPSHFKALVRAMYCAILVLTGWLVLRNAKQRADGKSLLQRLPVPPRVDLKAACVSGVSLPGLVLVGLCIGLVKGMLGIGGGVLFMPLLLLAVGMSAHKAVGTSLGIVLLSSVAGTIEHGRQGNVSLIVVMALLAGSAVGIQIGAAICDRMHARKLRRHFAVIVLLAAVMTAADLVKVLLSR